MGCQGDGRPPTAFRTDAIAQAEVSARKKQMATYGPRSGFSVLRKPATLENIGGCSRIRTCDPLIKSQLVLVLTC
jgi:hypothetical protein